MNQTKEITDAPKDCDNSGSIWETGKELFNFIKNQVLLNGATGKVAFDDQGDRINAEYDVVNIQQQTERFYPNRQYNNTLTRVGKYYFNRVSSFAKSSIFFKYQDNFATFFYRNIIKCIYM